MDTTQRVNAFEQQQQKVGIKDFVSGEFAENALFNSFIFNILPVGQW